MDDIRNSDPPRDPLIADALRRARPETATSERRLAELERRIVEAALPALERLQHPRPWWEWTAGWWRAAVPIGIAAGVAAVLLAAGSSARTSTRATPDRRVAERSALLAAVASGEVRGGTDVVDAFLDPISHDWLLRAAVQRDARPLEQPSGQ